VSTSDNGESGWATCAVLMSAFSYCCLQRIDWSDKRERHGETETRKDRGPD
jgi:hypothetical protein